MIVNGKLTSCLDGWLIFREVVILWFVTVPYQLLANFWAQLQQPTRISILPYYGELANPAIYWNLFWEHAYLNVQSCSTLPSIFLFFKNQNILHPSYFLNISCLIDNCAKVYKCTWLNIQMYLVKYTNVPG